MADLKTVLNPKWGTYDKGAGAIRTVPGMLAPLVDPADPTKSIPAIQVAIGAASASLTLLRERNYRAIASSACYLRLTTDGTAAVAGTDMYIPANVEFVINTDYFSVVSVVQVAAAGVLNCVELQDS